MINIREEISIKRNVSTNDPLGSKINSTTDPGHVSAEIA